MILLLPEASFRHQPYLEQLGKILRSLQEPSIVIALVSPPVLFQSSPVIVNEPLVTTFHGLFNKPLVDLFGSGMLPAISTFASDRKLIQWKDDKYQLNESVLSQLTAHHTTLICSPFLKSGSSFQSVSPLILAEKIGKGINQRIAFLTENLPPDGILTERELTVWANSSGREEEYQWVSFWNGDFPVYIISMSQINKVKTEPERILVLRKTL